MFEALAEVLACLAVGEILAGWTGSPIPGPVLGLVGLFATLALRGRPSDALSDLADSTLPHLSIVFVPAGVGAITCFDLIRANLVPILAAVIGGTAVTVGVTAAVVQALATRGSPRPQPFPGAGDDIPAQR